MRAVEREEKLLEEQVKQMEQSEYGIKELIHGILIGIIMGFAIAWLLLR